MFCVFLLWEKEHNAKDIIKEMFRVYGGKCSSCKAVLSWVEKFSQGCSKSTDNARSGAQMAETRVKILLCYGFRSTDKAMGQVYQCWWRICRETNVFLRFEYHKFYILYPFLNYLLTLPRVYRDCFESLTSDRFFAISRKWLCCFPRSPSFVRHSFCK
jgi:hypothetical protein